MKPDDVIKEMRSAATFGLLLSAIWLASSGSYVEALKHQAEMKQLMAYLVLKDDARSKLQDDVTPFQISRECPSPRETNCKAVEVDFNPPWDPSPDRPSIRLAVIPIRGDHNSYTTFEIERNLSENRLPFDLYCFDIGSQTVFHPPTGRPTHRFGTPPQTSSYCNFDNQLLEPYLWERMRGWLYSQGVKSLNPVNIHLSDPIVSKLAIQYLSPNGDLHQDIAGLSVPVYLAPFAIGALLVVLSSILVGTAAAFLDLRKSGNDDATPWVMLYVGYGRGFALIASMALAAGALALPLTALARTWTIMTSIEDPEVSRLPGYVLIFGLVVLSGTLAMNLGAQFGLRRTLTRHRQEKAATTEG